MYFISLRGFFVASIVSAMLWCLFVCVARSCFAADKIPYLTCTPVPPDGQNEWKAPQEYTVTVNGVAATVPIFTNTDGTVQLKYNMSGKLITGNNIIKVKAKNMQGESSEVSYPFSANLPVAPSGVGLKLE